ncbi:hypothetical protein BpHYR1_005428 [Brachionus plicatilis]|uniref:Uncharacterized protein n=1 Tax=Brachionus plicatilis TaxID=10195 RepID=A0A3M7PES5_BRAPC|nr:hypothetical protein BpHYR1_005428 [Brachionus plicatilis]
MLRLSFNLVFYSERALARQKKEKFNLIQSVYSMIGILSGGEVWRNNCCKIRQNIKGVVKFGAKTVAKTK